MPDALFQPFPMPERRRGQVWRHQPGYRRPRHFHAEPELNLITRGTATLGVGDALVRVGVGDVLLFHPGQDHVLLEASADLDLFVAALEPELADRACGSFAHAASHGCHLEAAELSAQAERLLALGDVRDGRVVEQGVIDLFHLVRTKLSVQHVLSRRALQYLEGQLEGSGAALARSLRVAPSELSRRFHGDLNLTFVEYRARKRTMRFVQLVDEGRALHGAALEAGFGSYAQCHRVLKRTFGCAPQRYFASERARIDQECLPDP